MCNVISLFYEFKVVIYQKNFHKNDKILNSNYEHIITIKKPKIKKNTYKYDAL